MVLKFEKISSKESYSFTSNIMCRSYAPYCFSCRRPNVIIVVDCRDGLMHSYQLDEVERRCRSTRDAPHVQIRGYWCWECITVGIPQGLSRLAPLGVDSTLVPDLGPMGIQFAERIFLETRRFNQLEIPKGEYFVKEDKDWEDLRDILDAISSTLVQLVRDLLGRASINTRPPPQQAQQAAFLCWEQHKSEVKVLFGRLNDIFSFNTVARFEAREGIPPYKVPLPWTFFPFASEVPADEKKEECPLCKEPFGPLQSGHLPCQMPEAPTRQF